MAKAAKDTLFLGKFYAKGAELPKEQAELSKPKSERAARMMGAEAYKPGFSGSGREQVYSPVGEDGSLRSSTLAQAGVGLQNEESTRAAQGEFAQMAADAEAEAMKDIAEMDEKAAKENEKAAKAAEKRASDKGHR